MRIGLVGTGFMGSIHARAWGRTPARLAGVVSTDAASRDAIAQAHGAAVYPTLADMLPHVDVVDICTPTHLHYEQVMAALAAGRHVVCEKPLARHAAQAQEMVSAARAAGLWLLVGHVVRFFPEYAQAKAIVESGQIGDVAVTRLTRCSFKPARGTAESWFHDPAKSGGMMLDLMIHDFDYARWIAGDVVSVFARRVARSFPQAAGDYALAILTHASGAISHVEGGWAYPPPMFRTALEIAGSAGLIEHPAASSVPLGIHLHESASASADIAVPTSPLARSPYEAQIDHFYDVLAGKEQALRVSAEDGYQALRIALAAIESADTGRKVSLS